MSTDSDIKLTKFKSAVTVVTSDFANSIFGGLYGSADSAGLSEDDPRVRGHVHDGLKGDGHAPRVHLVEHVESKLTNPNLADDAVTERNVFDTTEQADAIPEYRVDSGVTYYYLDLRAIRADLPFVEDEDPAGDGSQHKTIRQRSRYFDGSVYQDIEGVWDETEGFDFVFGSSSLDDLNLPSGAGDSRFLFDKSRAAFRAGLVIGDDWDEPNRGYGSFAAGVNTVASGAYSVVSGGTDNIATAGGSACLSGLSNAATGERSVVVSGGANTVSGERSVVVSGEENEVHESFSAVLSGVLNISTEPYSVVVSGQENEVHGTGSVILSGSTNLIQQDRGVILSGVSNEIHADDCLVLGGASNVINSSISYSFGILNVIDTDSESSGILGGTQSVIGKNCDYSTIFGSTKSRISDLSRLSSIIVGEECSIGEASPYSSIYSARETTVADNSPNSIVFGSSNSVQGQVNTVLGGYGNKVLRSNFSSIFNASGANIIDATYSYIIGSGVGSAQIGGSFTSGKGYAIKDSGSFRSGILGGYTNNISPGPGLGEQPPEYNYITSSNNSSIGGNEASVFGGQIFGGSFNELIADGSSSDIPVLLESSIFGGEGNIILISQASNEIRNSGIYGGTNNGINVTSSDLFPISPWFGEDAPFVLAKSPASGFGVQRSQIFGGEKNSITSTGSPVFADNSAGCSIFGGDGNIISSSFGSSIIGGGRVIDEASSTAINLSYDYGHWSNIISRAKNSVILGGSSNLISDYIFPFNGLGPFTSKLTPVSLPKPMFTLAMGSESYSYSYGQISKASGGHKQAKFEKLGFKSIGLDDYDPAQEPGTLWGSGINGNAVSDQPGSAQSFSLNYFGSWLYSKAQILAEPWSGMTYESGSKDSYFLSYATLDGSDSNVSDTKGFIPRWPGSYKIKINGSISFSRQNNDYQHGVVNFIYNAYIVMQANGNCIYGGVLEPSYGSHSNVSVGLLPGSGSSLGNDHDFLIGFVPFYDVDASIAASVGMFTLAHSAHNTVTLTAAGNEEARKVVNVGWPGPVNVPQEAWPYSFVIIIANNSSSPIPGSTNGTGNFLVGESLVANVDVVENMLHLTGPIGMGMA